MTTYRRVQPNSKLVSPRLGILIYLAQGEATSTEVADAIQRGRSQTWTLMTDLESDGYVRPVGKTWRLIRPGLAELQRLMNQLADIVSLCGEGV